MYPTIRKLVRQIGKENYFHMPGVEVRSFNPQLLIEQFDTRL